MLLEELLFCTVFLLLPVAGMVTMVIGRIIKSNVSVQLDDIHERLGLRFKKRKRNTMSVAFANNRIMAYQLVESQSHIPIQLSNRKGENHSRAGP